MSTEDLLGQLQAYALSTGSPTFELGQFLRSLPQGHLNARELETRVKDLAFSGALALEAGNGRLLSVSVPDLPYVALVEDYRRLLQDPNRPFPREETAAIPFPQAEIMAIDAKSQLRDLFEGEDSSAPSVVKLLFPGDVPSLIVPRVCARSELIDAAVARISRYLQEIRNAAYAESKLSALLRGNEVAARQALEDLVLRPMKAAGTILDPTELSFRFWNYLANILIQDTGRKAELAETDKGLLQSAYLVMYMVFYQKGAAQREQERAADRKALEQQVRGAPFVFGYQDLYQLRDEKGAAYSRKHSREFILDFVKEQLQKKDEAILPYLLRLHHAPTSKDYFVQRDMFVPVFLKKLGDASDTLRVNYVKDWVERLRQDEEPPVIREDSVFRKDLEARIRADFPILFTLANGPILKALLAGTSMDEETRQELARCFTSQGTLRTMPALLGLSRAKLLREARSYLPFWQTVPLIRGIARFLRRLFRARGQDPYRPHDTARSSTVLPVGAQHRASQPLEDAAPAPAAARVTSAGREAAADGVRPIDRRAIQQYRTSIRALISVYVPAEKSIDRVLDDLIDKWNPLLDPGPKIDLVRDVNALVRDFVRPIRRDFIAKPPDLNRVKLLAEQLSASRSLSKIRKREPLLSYLELYMLRVLSA